MQAINKTNSGGFSLIEALVSLMVLTIIGIAAVETMIFSGRIILHANHFRMMREHIECVAVAGYLGMDPGVLTGEKGVCDITSEPVELTLGTNVFQAVAWHVRPVTGTAPGLSAFIRE